MRQPAWYPVIEERDAGKTFESAAPGRFDRIAVDAPGHRWQAVMRGLIKPPHGQAGKPARHDVANHLRAREVHGQPAGAAVVHTPNPGFQASPGETTSPSGCRAIQRFQPRSKS